MKNQKKRCKIQDAIPKKYILPKKIWEYMEISIAKIGYVSKRGRKNIDLYSVLAGIYYVLITGIQWDALPLCFGSKSTVYDHFKRLEAYGFFKEVWHATLKEYVGKNPEALAVQASDCTHIPSPLGQEKTGKSAVNRSKLGTKRSVTVDKNGVTIGFALGSGNSHDSTLLLKTLNSIAGFIKEKLHWPEMHLDAAYDSKKTRDILFNTRYIPKINKNKRRSAKPQPQPACIAKRFFVEAAHSWANRCKRLLVRFEKLESRYAAFAIFSFSLTIFSKLGISG